MKFAVGDSVEQDFDVTDEKVREFAKVSGDHNPIHLDDDYAAKTKFGRRIAHGMLTSAFLSALMAEKLPGPGAAFLKQTLKFSSPVYINDRIRIKVEVADIKKTRSMMILKFQAIRTSDGQITFEGDCLALLT